MPKTNIWTEQPGWWVEAERKENGTVILALCNGTPGHSVDASVQVTLSSWRARDLANLMLGPSEEPDEREDS